MKAKWLTSEIVVFCCTRYFQLESKLCCSYIILSTVDGALKIWTVRLLWHCRQISRCQLNAFSVSVGGCWHAGGGQFCPTSLGPDPTSLHRLADNWSASLMLNNQVTCDSTLSQIVYFRGAPDSTAFVGVWRQLAADEYILKHRVALPPAAIGIHRVDLPSPLPVERGDFLGVHYPRDARSPSGGIVVHSIAADDADRSQPFYQTMVVDARDEDFPADRTIQLSSFSSHLESRTFALQAILVPDTLGLFSKFSAFGLFSKFSAFAAYSSRSQRRWCLNVQTLHFIKCCCAYGLITNSWNWWINHNFFSISHRSK